ncbi:hypothetical protein V8E51_010108 [Hyaloscypha variabilis]
MDSADSTLIEVSRFDDQPIDLEVDPQPIVEVQVIPPSGDTKTFRAHKNFICYYSPFFDAADIHEAFGIFVNWLYTQGIENSKKGLPCCEALIDLWLLADLVLVPRLQNDAMEKLEEARLLRKGLPTSVLTRAYNHTAKGSLLRRYIVRTWKNSKISGSDNYPCQFLVDLVNDSSYRACSETGKALKWNGWKTRELDLNQFFITEEEPIVREQRLTRPEDVERMPKKRKIDEVDHDAVEDLSFRASREDSTMAQVGWAPPRSSRTT